MLNVGLTGGIGSGKSTIAKVFEVLGIPVYYADERAKEIMNEDEALKRKIIQLFGNDAYSNNKLNRSFIAEQVFGNATKLSRLNEIVHPATIADAHQWLQQQKSPYAIKEAALIFESGAQEYLDKVIGVYAPTPLRIHRVMQRDNSSREEVMARLDKQLDETIKMRLCDYVITNNDQEMVLPQVLAIHEKLLEESSLKI